MPKWIKLSPDEQVSLGFTDKLVLNYADVVALTSGTAYSVVPVKNATTGAISIETAAAAQTAGRTVAAGMRVTNAAVRVTTAFVGTGTLVMIVGDDGDTARYAPSTTLTAAAYFASTLKMPFLYVTANTIDFIITAGTDITTFTAGEVEIYLGLQDLAPLNKPTVLANS